MNAERSAVVLSRSRVASDSFMTHRHARLNRLLQSSRKQPWKTLKVRRWACAMIPDRHIAPVIEMIVGFSGCMVPLILHGGVVDKLAFDWETAALLFTLCHLIVIYINRHKLTRRNKQSELDDLST